MITIDFQQKKKSKTAQIYEHIRAEITCGHMRAGEKLPSKRELAEHNGVSVITVENAYGMLEDEGYIYPKPRSGFYVSSLNLMPAASETEREIEMLPEEAIPESDFPLTSLARYGRRVLSEKPEVMYMQPPHFGCAVLRNAIAQYLGRYRDMSVSPANIMIGAGAEYLYGLLVQLFGRDIIYGLEFPSYEKIELVYRANGAETEHLEMGEDGITTQALVASQACVLHVSPYHSYPTGVTATAQKRYEYLNWASTRKAYIIEDDFDSEFAWFRKPITPLFSMDTEHRVIYMNTFSQSISPAIRIAYMILPDELLHECEDRLGFYACPVPVLDQYVLAEFIGSGAFERHLARLRHITRTI